VQYFGGWTKICLSRCKQTLNQHTFKKCIFYIYYGRTLPNTWLWNRKLFFASLNFPWLNVTQAVTTQQPMRVNRVKSGEPYSQPHLGLGAIVIAVVITVIFGTCFCWWGLPCSISGTIFGVTVSFCMSASLAFLWVWL